MVSFNNMTAHQQEAQQRYFPAIAIQQMPSSGASIPERLHGSPSFELAQLQVYFIGDRSLYELDAASGLGFAVVMADLRTP